MPLSIAHLRLVAISDRSTLKGDLLGAAEAVLAGGATAIMLREKDLAPRALHELALGLRRLTIKRGAALIVNRSVEVALAVGADAVHLGFDALDPTVAMTVAGDRVSIGLSAHTVEDVARATEEGLAYVTWSPVFAPTSKHSYLAPTGIDRLKGICATTSLPVVAVGGITSRNARVCIEAGAVGVAAIGSLFGAPDPCAAARAFREAMES
jgi:thiamine-phosphate pyrophosphorylase